MKEKVEINFVETKPLKIAGYTLIEGFPGMGLVGTISAKYLVEKLDFRQAGYLDSSLFVPIIRVHNGVPIHPSRIYVSNKHKLVVLISEQIIPQFFTHRLAKAVVNWTQKKKIASIISLSGIPVPNRQDIEKPSVFGAASLPETLNVLKEHGINVLESGIMVGPYALILRYCAEHGLPAIVLTAQCFFAYPDPEAAAAILAKLSEILGIEVDVEELLRKGEEIRLRARDVMRRTQRELARMRKAQEYDIPLYV